MSGSLARLVQRAQGSLPVAEPLLPSRYAAAGSPAGPLEEIGAEPVAQPSPSRQEPATSTPTRAPEPTAPTERSNLRPAPIGARDIDVKANGSPPVAEQAAPNAVVGPRSAPVARGGGEPTEPPPRQLSAATGPVRVAQSVPPDVVSVSPRPAEPSAGPAPANQDPRPSPGVSPFLAREAALAAGRAAIVQRPTSPVPDVHISIGRLEVHAAPAARATPSRAPARHPAVSLADYLARRR